MPTSRHPAYVWGRRTNEKGEALLDSTDAARLLRLNPSDPLFRRYDQLRANGALRPAVLDPVVLFRAKDVERLAAYDYTDTPAKLNAGEAVLLYALIGGVTLATAACLIVWIVR